MLPLHHLFASSFTSCRSWPSHDNRARSIALPKPTEYLLTTKQERRFEVSLSPPWAYDANLFLFIIVA